MSQSAPVRANEIEERGGGRTVDGIGKRLRVLEELLYGGLKDGKVALVVVEFGIGGLWEDRGTADVFENRRSRSSVKSSRIWRSNATV